MICLTARNRCVLFLERACMFMSDWSVAYIFESVLCLLHRVSFVIASIIDSDHCDGVQKWPRNKNNIFVFGHGSIHRQEYDHSFWSSTSSAVNSIT